MTESDLPRHKTDLAAARRIVDAGMPAIEPILGGILEWFQDCNWPVATVLEEILPDMGGEIVPHIQKVFASADDQWKHWMIMTVVPQLPPEVQVALQPDIARIAQHPTEGELTEEVSTEAAEYLQRIGKT